MLLANPGDPLDYAEVIGAGRPSPQPAASVHRGANHRGDGVGGDPQRGAAVRPRTRVKVSLRSPLMLPRVALVDPELALDLPPALTAATGMDALAQLIEPYVRATAPSRWWTPCAATAFPAWPGRCRARFATGRSRRPDRPGAGRLAIAASPWPTPGWGRCMASPASIGGAYPAPHGAVCAALLPGVFAANFQRLEKDPGGTSNAWKFHDVARMLTGDAGRRRRRTARAGWKICVNDCIFPALGVYGIAQPQVAGLVRQAGQSSSMKGNPVALPVDVLSAILLDAM
jgi:alcohol dehydrogenase class IV